MTWGPGRATSLARAIAIAFMAAVTGPWAGIGEARAQGPDEESVALPFACALEGGRPVLTPSSEHHFRIFGRRLSQPFTACPDGAGAGCRTWMLHRFEMQCGGARVPWVAVVAGAPRRPGRLWLDGHQLVMRVGPTHPVPFEGPCLRPGAPRFGPGAMARWGMPVYDRACAEPWRPFQHGATVRFPVGFAPVANLGARFVAASPKPKEVVRSPGPARTISDLIAADTASGGPTIRTSERPAPTALPPAPAPAPAAAEGPVATSGPVPGAATPVAPRSTGTIALAGPAPPPAEPGRGWFAATLRATGLSPPGPILFMLSGALMAVGLLMLMRRATPHRAAIGLAPREPAVEPKAAARPDSALRLRLPPPAPVKSEDAIATATAPAPGVGAPSSGEHAHDGPAAPVDSITEPSVQEGEACRELDATASALCQIVGQMIADLGPGSAIAPVLTEDLASIELVLRASGLRADLAAGRWASARPVLDTIIADLQRIRTLARIESERMLALVPREPRLPETFEAACEVLGVSTASELKVIKKVVDALRLTWHPDLAPDEAERVQREARIKQINAAWDVVQARARASA